MQIRSLNEIEERYLFIVMDLYSIFLLLNDNTQYFLVTCGKGYFWKIIRNSDVNIFGYILLGRFLSM